MECEIDRTDGIEGKSHDFTRAKVTQSGSNFCLGYKNLGQRLRQIPKRVIKDLYDGLKEFIHSNFRLGFLVLDNRDLNY